MPNTQNYRGDRAKHPKLRGVLSERSERRPRGRKIIIFRAEWAHAPREARNAGVKHLRPLLRDISQSLKESAA